MIYRIDMNEGKYYTDIRLRISWLAVDIWWTG